MAKTNCKAKTKSGKPCPNAAGVSGFCFVHDPALKAERAAARRKGGHHKRVAITTTPIEIKTVADVLTMVNRVISDTWQLANSPARARVLLAAFESAINVLREGKFEERLQALEAAAHAKQS